MLANFLLTYLGRGKTVIESSYREVTDSTISIIESIHKTMIVYKT